MRAVRSSGYFEQMKGRGVRVISSDDLQSVTGDATAKTHFIIVDAVGVCDSLKTDSQSLLGEPHSTEDSGGSSTRNMDQILDDISEDRILDTGFDDESFTQAGTVIHAFKKFIDQNMDELPELQILCKHPEAQGTLTEDNLKGLEETLLQHSNSLSRESLWLAYKRRSPENVRGNTEQHTDIISLVRFAMGESAFLEPFSVSVNRRFGEWLEGQTFTAEQQLWLGMIRDHIATSLDIRMGDFEYAPFAELGNGAKVYELFGEALDNLLKNLTEKLVS